MKPKYRPEHQNNRGSAAVEASIAVPILILVIVFFIQLCEVMTVDSVVFEAASEACEYMAEYAYLTDHISEAEALDYPMLTAKFIEYLDDATLLDRYVTGGKFGVIFAGSSFPDDEGYIDVTYTYFVSFRLPILSSFSGMRTGHIKQKAYLGERNTESEGTGETGKKEIVYVAERYGEVYHRNPNCTYLKPRIYSSTVQQASDKGLRRCRYCRGTKGDTVYFTEYGECYHGSSGCSQLNRVVRAVHLDEVGGLPPCSKCGY